MRELTNTDLRILQTARELFIRDGIMNTEMKDIANVMNCSRSTLYRHFSNKSEILMVLAEQAFSLFSASVVIPAALRFTSGYDALSWQLNTLISTLVLHVDEVTFLRDFDCLYTKEYPASTATKDFVSAVSGSIAGGPLRDSIEAGIRDGSIRNIDKTELFVITLTHSCLAMAQRVLPREQFFIREHGYGQEMLRYHVQFLLDSIRA